MTRVKIEVTNDEIREWLGNNKQIVDNPTHIVTAKEAEEKPRYYVKTIEHVTCDKCGLKFDISGWNIAEITNIKCSNCGNEYNNLTPKKD